MVPPISEDSSRMGDIGNENHVADIEDVGYNPAKSTDYPFDIEQHLEFMDISEDGHLLLSASNLVTNKWNSNLWIFRKCDVFPEKGESFCRTNFKSCVACGKFLESWDKIIIGEDSGKISILTVSTEYEPCHLIHNLHSTGHSGNVSSLCLIDNHTKSVSAGSDLRIHVWDNRTLELEQEYNSSHIWNISQVISGYDKTKPMFLSCALDGVALLWDHRQSKPASAVFEHKFGLTSLTWVNENIFAAGSIAGSIYLRDIRNRKDVITLNFHKHEIRHIASSKGMIAVCGHSNIVKVWDTSTSKLLYTSNVHTDLVRWLAWHPVSNVLYSCGHDRRIFSHSI